MRKAKCWKKVMVDHHVLTFESHAPNQNEFMLTVTERERDGTLIIEIPYTEGDVKLLAKTRHGDLVVDFGAHTRSAVEVGTKPIATEMKEGD